MPVTAPTRRTELFSLVGLLVAAATIRLWLFRGLLGSDDSIYAARGLQIASGLWLPSDYIGALRYGVNLPIAGAILLFGKSETVLAAWGLVSSLGEIAVVFLFALRTFGFRVAIFSGLALATLPEHIDAATNIGADAPFAMALTVAMVLLYTGAQRGNKSLLFLAGIASGLAGWVKPEPAVVFSLVIGAMALILVRHRGRVLWMLFGAAIAAAANLALFGWAFGDPFHYLHAAAKNLTTNFVSTTAPWGIHDGSFYFRLLFLDGRAFWIAPLLAIAGALIAARIRVNPQRSAGQFTLWWIALLLATFSFFVYSVSPLRFIPKQTNYALIFSAPIALLAGIAMAKSPRAIGVAIALVMGIGGLMLGFLDGLNREIRASTNYEAIRFARNHEETNVLASTQTLNLNIVLRLMGKEHAHNLRPLSALTDMASGSATSEMLQQVYAAYFPGWPEATSGLKEAFRTSRTSCITPVAEVTGARGSAAFFVTHIVLPIRRESPQWLGRHLSFVDKVLSPEPLRFYLIDTRCLSLEKEAQPKLSPHFTDVPKNVCFLWMEPKCQMGVAIAPERSPTSDNNTLPERLVDNLNGKQVESADHQAYDPWPSSAIGIAGHWFSAPFLLGGDDTGSVAESGELASPQRLAAIRTRSA